MRFDRRVLAGFLAAPLLALASVTTAQADSAVTGGAPNNSAVAQNTTNGSSVFNLAFSIVNASGPVVDNQNSAVAYASCTSCQTVAIAIQIVFITGNPSTVTPENAAVAVNYMCNACQTMASAYQFVVTGSDLTPDRAGWREIARIAREIAQLNEQGARLSIAQIQARLDVIVAQIKDVLTNHLVPEKGSEQEQSGASPSPSPETSSSSSSSSFTVTTSSSTNTDSTSTQSGSGSTSTP